MRSKQLFFSLLPWQLWTPVPPPVSAAEGLWLQLRSRGEAAVELLQMLLQHRREGGVSRGQRPQHRPGSGGETTPEAVCSRWFSHVWVSLLRLRPA